MDFVKTKLPIIIGVIIFIILCGLVWFSFLFF